ncbi:hypothetical protein [Hoeflea alexandrii]|uniref:hypothetical protein n=1 Tax=Hoeflea alexandrii TaxID=288436 RepID=UPI0022AF8458|nr:hypothetical protein [Hoeflea alexandrii]MCZ4289892.1 hypothetical protein [Hoeflea alexandrii]
MIGNPCKQASSHPPPLALVGDAAADPANSYQAFDLDRRGAALLQYAGFGANTIMTELENGDWEPVCQSELMAVKAADIDHGIFHIIAKLESQSATSHPRSGD